MSGSRTPGNLSGVGAKAPGTLPPHVEASLARLHQATTARAEETKMKTQAMKQWNATSMQSLHGALTTNEARSAAAAAAVNGHDIKSTTGPAMPKTAGVSMGSGPAYSSAASNILRGHQDTMDAVNSQIGETRSNFADKVKDMKLMGDAALEQTLGRGVPIDPNAPMPQQQAQLLMTMKQNMASHASVIAEAATPLFGFTNKLDQFLGTLTGLAGDNRRPNSFSADPQLAMMQDVDLFTALQNARRQAIWSQSKTVALWRSGKDPVGQFPPTAIPTAPSAIAAAAAKSVAATRLGAAATKTKSGESTNESTRTLPARPARFQWTSMSEMVGNRIVLGGNRMLQLKPPVMDPVVVSFLYGPVVESGPNIWRVDPDWKSVNEVTRVLDVNTNHATVVDLVVDEQTGVTYVLITSFAKEPNVASFWRDDAPPAATNLGQNSSAVQFGVNSPVAKTWIVRLQPDGTLDKDFDTAALGKIYPLVPLTGAAVDYRSGIIVVGVRVLSESDAKDMDHLLSSSIVLLNDKGQQLTKYDLAPNTVLNDVYWNPERTSVLAIGHAFNDLTTLDSRGFIQSLRMSDPDPQTNTIQLDPNAMMFEQDGLVIPIQEEDGLASTVRVLLPHPQGGFYAIVQRIGRDGIDSGTILVFTIPLGHGNGTLLGDFEPKPNMSVSITSATLSRDQTRIYIGGQTRQVANFVNSGINSLFVFSIKDATWKTADLVIHPEHSSIIQSIRVGPDATGILLAGHYMTGDLDQFYQGFVAFSDFS